MKRSLAALALVAGCLVLTSCTAPISYGVRLNSDGTVDYANCPSGIYSFEVDYRVGEENSYAEWVLLPDDRTVSMSNRIIEYGVIPDGYTGVALPPPEGWTTVEVGPGTFERTDLIIDDWVWEDNNFEWIPGQPCMDVD
jgi:hypothetical protein